VSAVIRHLRSNVPGYLALFLALGGTAYAAGRIGTADLKDNAVTSAKIANGQVKVGDLAASAYGAGVGRYDFGAQACNDKGGGVDCAKVSISLPRAGRMLISASANAFAAAGPGGTAWGECYVRSGPTYDIGPSHMVLENPPGTEQTTQAMISRTFVSDPVPAGKHSLELHCTDKSTGQAQAYWLDPMISVVALGNG
jgi:hypothetical protein